MAGLNKVMLIGNLGAVPELKTLSGGQTVCNFSLATTETWKNQDGAKQERTEWHQIVAWGSLAVFCNDYLDKGSRIFVEGRLQYSTWEGGKGVKRKTSEVLARKVLLLSPKKEDAEAETEEVPF